MDLYPGMNIALCGSDRLACLASGSDVARRGRRAKREDVDVISIEQAALKQL